MSGELKDFIHRRNVALNAGYLEVTSRLMGFLDWMEKNRPLRPILKMLERGGYGVEELEEAKASSFYEKRPPQPRELEDIASVGLAILRDARANGIHLHAIADQTGVKGKKWGKEHDCEAIIARYVIPFLDYVQQRVPVQEAGTRKLSESIVTEPAIIRDSLKKFRSVTRSSQSTCFVIMRFGKTLAHKRIEATIKKTLKKHRLTGLLARDREFHEDLFPNILTYLHGCNFGIAVFERLETETFNPNVALEVGYMLGLKKHVLLLKDRTLHALHTDLVGKLYREFDPQDPENSIPKEIDSWLSDKALA